MHGTFEEPPTGLIPWFSKTEGNTYATLLHHPFLFKGKLTHAQEVAPTRGRVGLKLGDAPGGIPSFFQRPSVFYSKLLLPVEHALVFP